MIQSVMVNNEFYTPKERGAVINQVCTSAVNMVAQRLIIENTGLRLKNLPFCQMFEADLIEEFVPRAKDGFALNMKASWLYPSEIAKMTSAASPLTIQEIWKNLSLKEKDNTLPEWGHTLATLTYLAHMGKATFNGFSDVPQMVGYNIGELESDWWTDELSPETIWNRMVELEELTRDALYNPELIGNTSLIKVGHFFAAGKELSRVFEFD
ncbi:MAG: hypothetical protein UW35_C0010G0028 [Candidatus Collierbacteria bacterium GW2011_GWF2_44_15]|uniref:Uncharacterized protein n=3 Tax=Candidatus Collieribacteriota TaxID=1752725 RepID=A0A0G1HHD4_9BACT|nr:MAG: hypothetical protein UW35_C0010G0028 [Candidatus Collierbacteria bacterium GW2011_GWF2_44_15]